jgi:hypothetical protein
MEETSVKHTEKKYAALLSIINGFENRLIWSELVYLALNLFIFIFTVSFIFSFIHKGLFSINSIGLAFVLYCLVVGMGICAYWMASASRQHLRLKLHYFQARYLEREIDRNGEYIYSDASVFFDPKIGSVESPDNKETITYPITGFSRMTGFLGMAKPRHFSWIMPCMFFAIYILIFIWVIIRFAIS